MGPTRTRAVRPRKPRSSLPKRRGLAGAEPTASRSCIAGSVPDRRHQAEKRAERTIAAVFLLGFLAAVAFFVVFCGAVPFDWQLAVAGDQNSRLYTPLLGVLLGLSLVCVGVGLVLFAKKLLPNETAVQDKHDGASDLTEQVLSPPLWSRVTRTGLARRKMIAHPGACRRGAGPDALIAPLGGLIKNPKARATRSTPRWAGHAAGPRRRPPDRPGDQEPGAGDGVPRRPRRQPGARRCDHADPAAAG